MKKLLLALVLTLGLSAPVAAQTLLNGTLNTADTDCSPTNANVRPCMQIDMRGVPSAGVYIDMTGTNTVVWEVNYGDGVRLEPNVTDPDYEQAMNEWRMMISYKAFDATMELGVDVEIDADALDRVKRVMAMVSTPLDEISDKVAYIKHCCMYDIQGEMPKLAAALRALAGPQEEDVADHVATFPDNVSRS